MAKFYPDLNKIKTSMRPKPEIGEMFLLEHFEKHLNDDWSVYYQAAIESSHPDIILMSKDIGIFIIEVKDWHLDSYNVSEGSDVKVHWKLESNNQPIFSPISQVNKYQWQVVNIIKQFFNLSEKDYIIKNIVGIVYFHNFSQEDINKVSDRYVKVLNRNMIVNHPIAKTLSLYTSNNDKEKFNEANIEKLKTIFKPSLNWMDTMFPDEKFHFNKKQQELSISRPEEIKFRGVAGSGKTFVLAKRAINAFNRTGQKVLILYFNITITNYFHDKISVFRENISWKAFDIHHFHGFMFNFIIQQLKILEEVKNINELIDIVKRKINSGYSIERYHTILIDEGQDFELEWFQFVKDYLLMPGGEFVICADEKQNIYEKNLEDNKTQTNIKGRWNELDESYRLSGNIKTIAQNFQKNFFPNEDLFVESNYKSSLFDPVVYFHRYNHFNLNEKIYQLVKNLKKQYVKDNDILILSHKHETLKSISNYLKEFNINNYYVSSDTDAKKGFYMNSNLIKIVSIQSFKGWESNTVILILDKYISKELLYTGMTRAITNLHIISTNDAYDLFFTKQQVMELVKVIDDQNSL